MTDRSTRALVASTSRVQVAPGQFSADLGKELSILNSVNGTYYGLNRVGADIWEVIASRGPLVVNEVAAAVVSRYGVDPERASADTISLLRQLADEGLIEILPEA